MEPQPQAQPEVSEITDRDTVRVLQTSLGALDVVLDDDLGRLCMHAGVVVTSLKAMERRLRD